MNPIYSIFYDKKFFKMEGAGNDYIYIDFTENDFSLSKIKTEKIPLLCNRRYGIGSDGLVILGRSYTADVKMYMWNSDGSYSHICGNALRCIGFYWYKKTGKKEFLIESGAGIHRSNIIEDNFDWGKVKVEMGNPIFDKIKIPFLGNEKSNELYKFKDPSILKEEGYVVSMGNPHCVFFAEEPDNIPIEDIGPKIEHHRLFPERTNVEFVKINSDGSIYQRTWERGSGETLACGSGACAVHVVSVLEKNTNKKNLIHLKGGTLEIEWNEQLWMTGNANFVYWGALTNSRFINLFY